MTKPKNHRDFASGVRFVELLLHALGRPVCLGGQRGELHRVAVGELVPDLAREVVDCLVKHRRRAIEDSGHPHDRLVRLREKRTWDDKHREEEKAQQSHRGRSIVHATPIP